MKAIWQVATELVGNSALDNAQIDYNPEVLYFWMRGLSSTEPGKSSEN